MNQEQYFEVSKNSNLPLRCPILNYCTRRAYTISFFSNYNRNPDVVTTLIKEGVLPNDFLKNQIHIQGELPGWSPGNNNFYFSGTCPEVNLFDSDHALFSGKACVEGDRDRDRKVSEKRSIKCQHYSECSEFNNYNFHKKANTTKQRKTIPNKTKALLQREIKSQCPFCANEDVDHFQIHHIDETPSNNEFDNLLMLCPNCHSKITKGDIRIDEVISIKKTLRRF